ncbi:MAG: hypothetical protein I3J02_08525 [Prevotella sp.]|nr:hypothetical protein [Prevotella sp.]
MRQYARIEEKKPESQPQDNAKPQPKKAEVDFDIAHEDVAEEFTIL